MIRRLLPVLFASLFVVAACGSAETEDHGQAHGIAIADAWVKATDMDMSAAFGVLSNSGDEDAKVTAVTTTITDTAELHETVDGKMSMVDGFTIPAGGSLALEPGGKHLMLLNLTEPIKPGDKIDFKLTFADDTEFEFSATAKDFMGADEDYNQGETAGH